MLSTRIKQPGSSSALALVMRDLATRPDGSLTCAKLFKMQDGKIVRDKLTFDSRLIWRMAA